MPPSELSKNLNGKSKLNHTPSKGVYITQDRLTTIINNSQEVPYIKSSFFTMLCFIITEDPGSFRASSSSGQQTKTAWRIV